MGIFFSFFFIIIVTNPLIVYQIKWMAVEVATGELKACFIIVLGILLTGIYVTPVPHT